MALEIDPLYQTATMVRILREQGCSQHAMELSEQILAEKGPNAAVEQILAELKEEARRAFERFKNGGRPSERPEEEARDELAFEAIEAVEGNESAAAVENPAAADIPEAGETLEAVATAREEFPLDLSASETSEEPRETRLALVPEAPLPSLPSRLVRLQELLERVERNRLRP